MLWRPERGRVSTMRAPPGVTCTACRSRFKICLVLAAAAAAAAAAEEERYLIQKG